VLAAHSNSPANSLRSALILPIDDGPRRFWALAPLLAQLLVRAAHRGVYVGDAVSLSTAVPVDCSHWE
jgi:hypothetical protein